MIYGERVRYARNKLGISRIKLSEILNTTPASIANVENCKDESKKLGWDKTKELLRITGLPKGFFFYDDDEVHAWVVAGEEVFVRGNYRPPTEEELRLIVGSLANLKESHNA